MIAQNTESRGQPGVQGFLKSDYDLNHFYPERANEWTVLWQKRVNYFVTTEHVVSLLSFLLFFFIFFSYYLKNKLNIIKKKKVSRENYSERLFFEGE